jgi:hypothetical protein
MRPNKGTRVLVRSDRRHRGDADNCDGRRPPDHPVGARHRMPPSSANSAANTTGGMYVEARVLLAGAPTYIIDARAFNREPLMPLIKDV